MVVSSMVVDATPGKVRSASQALARIPGVTVHNQEGIKIVITIEADSPQNVTRAMQAVLSVEGVLDATLIYCDDDADSRV